MKGIKNGNAKKNESRKTFERLYNEYFNSIYRFAYGLLGNSEEAEEITQDTFMKLYNYLKSPFTLKNPKAWIYRVAANNCCTLLKRKTKYREIIEGNIQPQFSEKSESNIEEEFIKREEINIIRKTINKLAPKEQVVLMLYLEGFPYAKMAKMTNIKKSSIGVIISRAVDKIYQNIRLQRGI